MREDVLHQRLKKILMELGYEEGEDFDQYVTKNPDYILTAWSCLGEIKTGKGLSQIREAFREIYERKGKHKIENYPYYFILLQDEARVYLTDKMERKAIYDRSDYEKSECTFRFDKVGIEQMLTYLSNSCRKIKIDNFLPDVLDTMLADTYFLTPQDVCTVLLHLKKGTTTFYTKSDKTLYFKDKNGDEGKVEDISESEYKDLMQTIINKFVIGDEESVKEYIRHNYSRHLSERKRANLGKYYTPKEIVTEIEDMMEGQISQKGYVLDPCCGCGAFLSDKFKRHRMIARDIDEGAISMVDMFGIGDMVNTGTDNSLYEIGREKYGLNEEDELHIIGNPPYNNESSRTKRYRTKTKDGEGMKKDEDIQSSDLGIEFLRMGAKLDADTICMIHPLSYLIKETNFRQLKEFKEKYRLKKGIIHSSHIFDDLRKRQTIAFPVVVAMYVKGSMDYNYIRDFTFDVSETGETFTLSKTRTMDDLPNIQRLKYPPCKGMETKSDINIYQYNWRDANSIISSGNIIWENENHEERRHYIPVQYENLKYFAYINCYKHFMSRNYLYGNLSPLCIEEDMENRRVCDMLIMGMLLKNENRDGFSNELDLENKESIMYKKYLWSDFMNKSKKGDNLYQFFLEYARTGEEQYKEGIYKEIGKYFETVKERATSD